MIEKLQKVEDKFREIESQLGDPSVVADVDRFTKLTRELSNLEPIVKKFQAYKKILAQIEEDKNLLETGDEELKSLATEELADLKKSKAELDGELPILLLPKDPNDDKNVIVEIRGGVGGEEAALFAGDLFKMYARYSERQGWKVDIVDSNPTNIGGFKEIFFTVDGAGAFSKLKYESGTHRVQRVPVTESSGRIHTSAVTVAVLPEVEEVDVEINPADLRIDTYCASGAGGQYVNRTETAIRITHLPTGIVVQCQDEKSQLKNKEKAMKVLRARVRDVAVREQNESIAADRKNQVGSGDRSERIRTYNFPQGRVTDHRIGLTLHKLDSVLNGDVYVVGDFDPTFTYEKLRDIADALIGQGVKCVRGTLYADISMRDTLLYGKGWCWDDVPSTYEPYLSALMFNRGQNAPASTKYSKDPAFRPWTHFLITLGDVLKEKGVIAISAEGDTLESFSHGVKTLLSKYSPRCFYTNSTTVEQVLQRTLKNSDNLYAESLFWKLAKINKNKGCTEKDGVRQIEKVLRKAGVAINDVEIADGSGVSLYDYHTANTQIALLRYAYQNHNIFDYLYPALPISGKDGTLSKRMTTGNVQYNVHAKTGTLKGVSSLSGYINAPNGHLFAFSIIINGVMKNKTGQDFQDRICTIIAD